MSSALNWSVAQSQQRAVEARAEARAVQAEYRRELRAARQQDAAGRRPLQRLRPVARLAALVVRHA